MMRQIIVFSLLVYSFSICAQIDDARNRDVAPKEGINNLAIQYFGIEFSKEQREILRDKEIEFIFNVDEEGKPTLAELNGISDIDIIDSLKSKTKELENFYPQIENDIPVPSMFFMQLTYPTYSKSLEKEVFLRNYNFDRLSMDDFEYITKSNSRFDVVVGGVTNQFLGNPSNYLKIGGGLRTGVSFTTKKNLLIGYNASFYENKRKLEYPINSNREQSSSPVTLLVGISIGTWINKFSIIGEIDYAALNVTEKLDSDDRNWVQFKGWSPGVTANFLISIGKESPMYYYGKPKITSHNLNISASFRYVKLSISEASGFMAELGLSYRLTMLGIQDFKLKENID